MNRRLLTVPAVLVAVGALGLTAAGPASAGGGVSCSFASTTTAAVTSVDLPDPVRAGSTVPAVVTIERQAGSTEPVEVSLAPSSWTRTNACVVVPAGRTSATFDVEISPVRTEDQYATVGAYATPGGEDYHGASSSIVPR
jgi:hypothetical protein